MSTSRDNLPAAPGETPEPKVPTVIGTIWAAAEWVVKRDMLLRLLTVATLVSLGAAGVVWAQDKLDGGVEHRVAPLEARQTELEAKVKRVEQQVANVERLGLETNLNVRLMLESRGIKPIDVAPNDGGQ